MPTRIAKWGNSLALRLPRNVAADANLNEGTAVELHVEGDSLVVTAARPKYRLSELLSQSKPEHRQEEAEWGGQRGDEQW